MTILNYIFSMSIAGSLVFLLFLLIERITKQSFSALWHYRILKIILIFYIIPIGNIIDILFGKPFKALIGQESIIGSNYFKLTGNHVNENTLLYRGILLIWIFGIAAFLIWQVFCYIKFRYIIVSDKKIVNSRVCEIAELCAKKFGIKKQVQIYVNENINTPMLIGFISPIILLPSDEMKTMNIEYILSHELIHYKKKDMIIKLFVLLIRILYWFNPFLYLYSVELDKWCEYACDEMSTKKLSHDKRRQYGLAILEAAAVMPVYSSNFGTPFLNAKQNLNKRLMFMLDAKTAKNTRIVLSLVIAIAFVSLGASIACMGEVLTSSNQQEKSIKTQIYDKNYQSTILSDKMSDRIR